MIAEIDLYFSLSQFQATTGVRFFSRDDVPASNAKKFVDLLEPP